MHRGKGSLAVRVQDAVLNGAALAIKVVVLLQLRLLCVQLCQPLLDRLELHSGIYSVSMHGVQTRTASMHALALPVSTDTAISARALTLPLLGSRAHSSKHHQITQTIVRKTFGDH